VKENTPYIEQYCLLWYNAVYSVKSQPTFRRNISPLSSWSNKPSKISAAFHLLSRLHLARLIWTWRWRLYVLPKRRVIFNRLHRVISQKTVLFNIMSAFFLKKFFSLLMRYVSAATSAELRLCQSKFRTRIFMSFQDQFDRLCVLVVRVPGYRSRGPGFSIPRATRFSEK
jgi:hypothetical protein